MMRLRAVPVLIAIVAAGAIANPAEAQRYYGGYYSYPIAPYVHSSGRKPDNSGKHDKAEAAMAEGNYAEAFCVWRPLAEAGDVHAQYSLGWMYHNGYGLSIDDERAQEWWGKAANQNDADSQYALATSLMDRPKKERDTAKALEWLGKAIANGHEDARDFLRDLTARGVDGARELYQQLLAKNWKKLTTPLVVSVEKANVRSGPDVGKKLVASLTRDAALGELSRHGDWVEVWLPEQSQVGWIYGKLVAAPTLEPGAKKP